MQPIHIIGVPLDLGGNRRGTDMGPSAFRIAGLSDRLAKLGLQVTDQGDVASPIPEAGGPGDPQKRYVKEIAKVCQRVAPWNSEVKAGPSAPSHRVSAGFNAKHRAAISIAVPIRLSCIVVSVRQCRSGHRSRRAFSR